MQHWENLCECKPRKRHFRYRHSLAELNDMVVMMDKPSSEEMIEKRNTRANESPSLSKKVLISTKLLSILNHVLYISAYFNLFASLISFLNRVFKLFTNFGEFDTFFFS